jgi:hypothetical protein
MTEGKGDAMDVSEIDIDNAIWREPGRQHQFWVVKNADTTDPSNYPVTVLDVDGNNIGTAANKEEYMAIWNASADNQATKGRLIGEHYPFVFSIARISETTTGALIDEGDDFILAGEDGEILISE